MVHTEPEEAAANKQDDTKDSPLVQYIVVRSDLNWGTGAMIAQACHASVAAIASTLGEQTTKEYLVDLENMHKVILKADKLDDITIAEEKLKEANIAHHLWVERPENVVSCLACSPQRKALVQSIFKHLKLFRADIRDWLLFTLTRLLRQVPEVKEENVYSQEE